MSTPTPTADWIAKIKAAEAQGDLIQAYDHAMQALDEYPDETALQYRAVLNLSRAGSFDKPAELWKRWQLDRFADDEKIASVGARLVRERGLIARGERRRRLLWDAAKRYEKIHLQTGGSFSAANAASMFLLAGDVGDARHAEDLAERVLAICAERAADTELSDYYTASDGATAALILGDLDATEKYLRQCAATHRDNFMLLANTRRQLRRICQAKALDEAILDVASLPAVIHYTGHMITVLEKGGRFPAAQEQRVHEEIAKHLDQYPVGFAFGGLACGADLMIVEALLERGAHVHVILPFDIEAYKAYSVAHAGRVWMERFDACLARITQLTFVTQDRLQGDTMLFAHASRLAMGMAKLRAAALDAPLEQLAVWDRELPLEEAGTAANIAFWNSELALRTHVIDSGGERPRLARRTNAGVRQRTVRALLFGDVKGFSSLSDSQMPSFVEAIMQPIGATLRGYEGIVDFCNTWGDGLFVVFKDIEAAARCALAIQERLAGVELAEFGLPETLGMRLGVHAGPVIALQDPVTDGPNFFGAHVSRTARIEPVTPEGEVYVTEDFAALLTLAKSPDLVMEYVGKIDAAKNYGTLRMYSLRRQPTGVAVAVGSARGAEGNRQHPQPSRLL